MGRLRLAARRVMRRSGIATTFRDPRLQSELEDVGYVIVPFLDVAECSDLSALCGRVLPGRTMAFETTALQPDRAQFAWLVDEFVAKFSQRIDRLVLDQRILCAQFLLKRPSLDAFDGDIELHQDLSFVDDRQWRGLLMWCPLTEIAEDGGRLQVVRGSHSFSREPRGTGCMPWQFSNAEKQLRSALEVVNVGAGHAVFYDSALIHASSPNTSGADRPVLGLALTPRKADLVRYHADEPGRVERLVVPSSYFVLDQLRDRPESPLSSSLIGGAPSMISSDELAAMLRERPGG